MTNDLQIIPRPQNLTEAMKVADMIAKSSFAPKGMTKPGDILLAWQLGAEIGLSLMQSLQNIAVINGRPSIYGDAALAVVQNHPHYKGHREWFEGDVKAGTRTAYCGITRAGSPEHVAAFSIEDAKRAQLYGKAGPWSQYLDRMLQMRARGFAVRDQFSDALRGIITREEAEDYSQPVPAQPQQVNVRVLPVPDVIPEIAFDFSRIDSCETVAELETLYRLLKVECQDHPDHYKMLNRLTHEHKKYLEDKDNAERATDANDPTTLPADERVQSAVG